MADGAKKPSWTQRAVSHDSARVAFALGIVLDLPSLWYLLALKDLAVSGHSSAAKLLMIVVFNVIMFLLVEIPLAAYLIDAERAQRNVSRFNAWLHGNARRIAEVLLATTGSYLVVRGVVDL